LYPGDIFGYDPMMTGMSERDYTNDIANKNKYEHEQDKTQKQFHMK
jgi:hypothetical protein